jgi:PKD repeat protein
MRNVPEGSGNFHEVRKAFYDYWKDRPIEKGKGYKPFKRWEWYWETRVSKTGEFPSPSVTWDTWHEYIKTHPEVAGGNSYKTQAGPNWSFKGPSTTPGGYRGLGRINCMAFHPSNANTFWVGSPGGGLWKTTNGGTSWTTNTDNLPVIGVSDIAINPSNASIMYIATGDGDKGSLSSLTNGAAGDTKSIGVLKSTDGGNTWNTTGLNWTITPPTKLIRRLIINPNNPQILMAAASDGIWRTTDAGTSWSNMQSDYFMDIEFKPTDPNYVYASTFNTSGGAEIHRSTDGGLTWNWVVAYPTVSRIDLGVTPNFPDLIDAVLVNQSDDGLAGMVLSNNSGATFSQYISGSCSFNLLDWSHDASGCGGQGTYDLAYAINPNNSNDIWLGGINVWNTSDGGSTWGIKTMWISDPTENPNGVPVVHADVHYIAFHPLQSNTIFVCNDGGIYKTTNAGSSWTDLSNGLQISQMYKIGVAQTASENIIIGLQDNGSREVSNNIWYDRTGGDGMDCAIDYTDELIQYASYAKGVIYRTLDGWANQQTISNNISTPAPEGAWVTPIAIDPTTPSTIYAGYDILYKSTNRGNSWLPISGIISASVKIHSLAIAPSNSNYIYCASIDTFYYTTNGGANWFYNSSQVQSGILPITNIAVDPTNPQEVYITIGNYNAGQKVYKSTDAGTTWTNFSGTLPNLPVNCIVYETGSSDRLYIGTDVGVFYREASMNDWLAYNTGLPNVVVTDLEISYQDNKLWAGTFGRGLWSTDLAGTPPPAAAFTANNTLICAGNCVNFTDNSTQSPSSWSWSFPGASTASSTQQNPGNICYPTAGTYNVSLTATNSSGSGSATLTGYIVVGSGPTTPIIQASPAASFCQGASATINVTNPCSGCTFTWTPGGQTGSSITTTTAGNYIVAAADNCGQTASAPLTITIFPTPSTPSISINGNLLFTSVASNYQWYLNGNPIPGATQQTYQPTAAGNYTVEIQDANNCTATSAPVTFTPTSRDASSVNTGSILKVYPNPAQDDLEISMLNLPETKSLIILNILGEKLLDVKISPSNTSTAVFKINTSSIPAGNYLIGIEGEDRQTFQKFSILR